MQQSERYILAKRITLFGATINALLGLVKLIGGFMFHSHALIADGFHSFSDLITDLMVLFASKYGSQDADASHPYGHKRIETAATLLLALLLILAGIGIAWDSISELLDMQHTKPKFMALPIALLSIVANEALFHYTHHIGLKIQSNLIIANAWHHRSDAASSVVVLVGLIGSLSGWLFLDAVAAVVVGGLIVQMGWSYGWNSVKELVDTAVDPDFFMKIEHIIKQINGVHKVHQLRTRLMGGDIFIDVHILVSPQLSVSEGHYIAQQVHRTLTKQLDQVKDVTVHVDPEDDETCAPSFNLPDRETIERSFLMKLREDYPDIQEWVLHYINGCLSIDLIYNQSITSQNDLKKRISEYLSSQTHIVTVRLLSHAETLAILRTAPNIT